MSFEHLFTNRPIAKEIEIAGVKETFYFRKLTAGEQITLNKGQKTTLEAGSSKMEVDISDLHARNCTFLSYVWVDENGARKFSKDKLSEIPADYIAIIVSGASDALDGEKTPQ